jgi:hypothetical protein
MAAIVQTDGVKPCVGSALIVAVKRHSAALPINRNSHKKGSKVSNNELLSRLSRTEDLRMAQLVQISQDLVNRDLVRKNPQKGASSTSRKRKNGDSNTLLSVIVSFEDIP